LMLSNTSPATEFSHHDVVWNCARYGLTAYCTGHFLATILTDLSYTVSFSVPGASELIFSCSYCVSMGGSSVCSQHSYHYEGLENKLRPFHTRPSNLTDTDVSESSGKVIYHLVIWIMT
jgi:hypothetical protein